MTYDEESYILDSIAQIKAETHENNIMLSQLCSVVNVYLANHIRRMKMTLVEMSLLILSVMFLI